MKRPILSKASAILFVSLSAVGAERLEDPKLLKSKAKKRLRTYGRTHDGPSALGSMRHTYHKVTDHNRGEEKWNTRYVTHKHTVPHRFYPFSTQYSKHYHKRMHKIGKIPAWKFVVGKTVDII